MINNILFIYKNSFINKLLFINYILFIQFVLTFATSCSDEKLPKYTELRELRILALVASSPEVGAGGTTTITPVVSDIAETTSLTYEAVACLDPGVGIGVEPTCDGSSSAVAIQNGTLNSGNMTAAKGFTGSATSFTVTVPASNIIFSQQSSQNQFNGVSYLVTYKVTNSSGLSVKSFKRIIVSTKSAGARNNNPILTSVLGNNSALSSTLPASQSISLSLNLGTPAAEAYTYQKSDGSTDTRNEELLTTWFITDGTMKYYRTIGTDPNTWDAPPSLPTGRDVFIITIMRDGRGGLAFTKNCFGTCP